MSIRKEDHTERWERKTQWGKVLIANWFRSNGEKVWNIYFEVTDKETLEHLRYHETKSEASSVFHGGVSHDSRTKEGGWIFGCDYSHGGDEAHERGEYDYDYYLEESKEAEEYFSRFIRQRVKVGKLVCTAIGSDIKPRGEFRMSGPLDRFKIGDHSSYINDKMSGSLIPRDRFVIEEQEARELVAPLGHRMNLNKKFVCIADGNEYLFVYQHDGTYWLYSYEVPA